MVSNEKFYSSDLLAALKRLEYRGYDSFGFATNTGFIEKELGSITFEKNQHECTTAISHTRWATHGGVTKENAHPHTDCKNGLFVVHNGIIENYNELKSDLEKKGHDFRSQTDTEAIAHFFEEELKSKTMEKAILEFFSIAKGTFAILMLKKGDNKIYALKRDSPLVLGIAENENILASDIYAFSDTTKRAIFFDNDEFAIIDSDGYRFFDKNGREEKKEIKIFEWTQEASMQSEYEHFMIKEIMESPLASERLIKSLETIQKDKVDKLVEMMEDSRKIMFLAAGTSYHASLLGCYFLHECGIEASAVIASEFKDSVIVDDKTLIVAISQSGETMDVIEAIKLSKEKGAKIASIVNVPYSSVQRLSDISIEVFADQEICVAATKTFVNQTIILLNVAKKLGYSIDLEEIPVKINQLFTQEEKIKKMAKELLDARDIYILGRGFCYPVSREIALKLKEIAYIHAEGMMGGELKHGTIALIENGTPVIGLMNGRHDIYSNIKEVEARGAAVISITSNLSKNYIGDEIKINCEENGAYAILSTLFGYLLTYYIAKEKGLPIDKPRNLAKSVTVL